MYKLWNDTSDIGRWKPEVRPYTYNKHWIMMSLQVGLVRWQQPVSGPVAFRTRQIFPTGRQAHQNAQPVRDWNQSTYRAPTRTRRLSGHAARDKASLTQAYPIHGRCAVSTETGSYVGSIVQPADVW